MMGRHRANLVVAISISVLIAGGLLTYLWWPHHASVAWGRATTLRGAPGVNLGSSADLYSLSCSSPGDCSAVGSYSVKVNHNRAIIVNERRGQWGKVEVLPGLSAREEGLNTGASVVSCSSPGDCSAGGTYAVGDNQLLLFVANESDGVWGRVQKVRGVSTLGTGYFAYLSTISCASPGDCSAGGGNSGANGARAFVVSEVRGSWGPFELVAGPSTRAMEGSGISSMSCSAPGDCSAVGTEQKGSVPLPAFAVSETNGVWGRAKVIPGLAALSPGGSDYTISLSCAAVGSCGASGTFRAQTGVTQSFLVDETHGVWGRAFDIPGIVALDGRHLEQLHSISCGAPGDCVAGGSYGTGSYQRAFLVSEVRGRWGMAMPISGLSALNRGHFTSVVDISCGSAGNCGVIGSYTGKGGYVQSFALNETSGAWGGVTEVGASSFPGAIGAQVNAISCNASSNCAIVGVVFGSKSSGAIFVQSTRPTP